MSVAELSKPFDITKSAVTKHLKVLESAGLLRRRIEGRVHHCQLQPEPLEAVSDWVKTYEKFWSEGLDRLDAYLQQSRQGDN